ncbi:MAG: ParB N-terminal domain-containing protein [Kineothrix sp.]
MSIQILDDDKMTELSESVRTHGVLVSGIVRIKDTGGYEIIAGHGHRVMSLEMN